MRNTILSCIWKKQLSVVELFLQTQAWLNISAPATQPSIFVILFTSPEKSALESIDGFEFLYYYPEDACLSQASFLHPTPLLFDPPLHPPLSTTDLRLRNNVSRSLV